MKPIYASDLFQRIHSELTAIPIIDCHEHLQRENELPQTNAVHIGRFFIHYANCDLVSAGMPLADMNRVQNDLELTVLRNLLKSIHDRLMFGSCFIERCRMSRSYMLSTGVTSRGTRGSLFQA